MSRRAVPLALSDLQLLRLSDAAAIARLSERTLRRALHAPQNRLQCYRFGRAVRIAPDDLTEWLRTHVARPVVSTTVLDSVSADAKALIQSLDRPTNRGAGPGDRTAKVSPKAPANILAPEPPTRLDCGAESSVHVATEPRSKEDPIPMHDESPKARTRAKPPRLLRAAR